MPKKKSKNFDYFDEFAKLSALAVQEADLFVEAVEKWESAEAMQPILERAHEIEHEGDIINRTVYRQAAKEFVTPIEREDLLAMAQDLDNVIDLIEDVMVDFYIYDAQFMAEGTLEFAKLIKKSCVALNKSMEDFREFKRSKKLRERIDAVNDCEEEGDALYVKVMRHMHVADNASPMRVLVWSRLFMAMEDCCDACEKVADTMDMVLLRNS